MSNAIKELYKLSAHNCSNVFGVLLESCDGRMLNITKASRLPWFFREWRVMVVT